MTGTVSLGRWVAVRLSGPLLLSVGCLLLCMMPGQRLGFQSLESGHLTCWKQPKDVVRFKWLWFLCDEIHAVLWPGQINLYQHHHTSMGQHLILSCYFGSCKYIRPGLNSSNTMFFCRVGATWWPSVPIPELLSVSLVQSCGEASRCDRSFSAGVVVTFQNWSFVLESLTFVQECYRL